MTENFEVRKLLQDEHGHKNGKYFRWVHECKDDGLVYLLVVHKNGRPGTKLPTAKNIAVVDSTMRVVAEEIADPQMTSWHETKLAETWKVARDRRWPAVREVILNTPAILKDAAFANTCFKRVAGKFGVNEEALKRWVVTYWWYGGVRNALLERGWARGKSKTGKRKVSKKLGRPNALEMDGYVHLKGVNSEWFIPLIKRALLLFWVGQNESLPRTYDLMVQTLLVATTRVQGKIITRPVRPEKVPTLGQFLYRAKQLIVDDPELKRGKAGAIEYRQKHDALPGAASDLALWPGDILDMDGTLFNWELVAGWDQSRNIGRPYVLFAVDRASTAILGFFIWYKGESWDAYRQLVLMACSPKDDLLVKHGFKEDDWRLYGIPSRFFVDNGPGAASLKAKAALLERLGSDRMHAPIRHGECKPQVENHQGIVQRATSTHNGAFKREGPLRERDKRRRAKVEADAVHESFERALLTEVIQFNKYTHIPHYLTEDMRDDHVEPTPEEIYLWGRRNRWGDAAVEWETTDTYRKLLDRVRASARDGVVEYKRQRYSSPASVEMYRRWKRVPGRRRGAGPKITICPLPFQPQKLLWEHEDGSFSELERQRKSGEAYSGKTWREVERKLSDDAGSAIMTQHKKTSRGLLSSEQARRVAKTAGVKLPPKRGSATAARTMQHRAIVNELASRDERILTTGSVRPSAVEAQQRDPGATPFADSDEFEQLFNKKFMG